MRGGLGILAAAIVTAAIASTSEVAHAGSITIGGQTLDVPVHGFAGGVTSEDVHVAQSIIDQGLIASGRNPLNFSDGLNTHLMAHNPGVFTTVADSIHNGAKYVVTDHNGVSKVFEFYYVGEQLPFTNIAHQGILDAVYGSPGEVVTLQYCAYGTNIPQVWIGYISEDQSLLNVEPDPEPAPVTLPLEEEQNELPTTELEEEPDSQALEGFEIELDEPVEEEVQVPDYVSAEEIAETEIPLPQSNEGEERLRVEVERIKIQPKVLEGPQKLWGGIGASLMSAAVTVMPAESRKEKRDEKNS